MPKYCIRDMETICSLDPSAILTPVEVAKLLGMTVQGVRQLRVRGKLAFTTTGTRYSTTAGELRAYAETASRVALERILS